MIFLRVRSLPQASPIGGVATNQRLAQIHQRLAWSAPSNIRQTTAMVLLEACISIGISTLPPVCRKIHATTIEKQKTLIVHGARFQAKYSTPTSGRCHTAWIAPRISAADNALRPTSSRGRTKPRQPDSSPRPIQRKMKTKRTARPAGVRHLERLQRLRAQHDVDADRSEGHHHRAGEHDEVPDQADAPEDDAAGQGIGS